MSDIAVAGLLILTLFLILGSGVWIGVTMTEPPRCCSPDRAAPQPLRSIALTSRSITSRLTAPR